MLMISVIINLLIMIITQTLVIIDGLILMAYQTFSGYSKLNGLGIVFNVGYFLKFLCTCFIRIIFCTGSYRIRINGKHINLTL